MTILRPPVLSPALLASVPAIQAVPGGAVPDPRLRRFSENPITFEVSGYPSRQPFQAEFFTADLKLNADGWVSILEFNGIHSGTSGYERLHPERSPAEREPRRAFFEILAKTGAPLYWIRPDPFEGVPIEGLNHIGVVGIEPWLQAGGRIVDHEDFIRRFRPHRHAAKRIYSLMDEEEDGLPKEWISPERVLATLSQLKEEGLASEESLRALKKNYVDKAEHLGSQRDAIHFETLDTFVQEYFGDRNEPEPATPEGYVLSTHGGLALGGGIVQLNAGMELYYGSKEIQCELFSEEAIRSFHPRTRVIKRSEGPFPEERIQTLLADFQSDHVILKPTHLSQGKGAVILPRENAVRVLRFLFNVPGYFKEELDLAALIEPRRNTLLQTLLGCMDHLRGLPWRDLIGSDWPPGVGGEEALRELTRKLGMNWETFFHYAAGGYGDSFVLQEFIPGKPVRSPETGSVYDPTMRLIMGLVRDRKNVRFYPLDAYWKLPEQTIDQGPAISDVHAGEKSLAVEEADYQTVVAQMAVAIRTFFDHLLSYREQMMTSPALGF